jgi:hypothetical protein
MSVSLKHIKNNIFSDKKSRIYLHLESPNKAERLQKFNLFFGLIARVCAIEGLLTKRRSRRSQTVGLTKRYGIHLYRSI